MIGKTWGLKPHIMKWLYLTVVRSSVTYASIVWWPKVLQTTTQQELQKFQRQALLSITGSMCTTPTAAMEVILGIPPLHLHIKEEATLTALRLKTCGLWKQTNTAHTNILKEGIQVTPSMEWICDKTQKQFVMDKPYKINTEEAGDYYTNPDALDVYTDGSKTDTGTGAGVYCQDLNIRIAQALGLTDSPLCRACMEEDETPLHVMLSCRGVTEQRATYIGSSATLHEAIGDLGGLLSFWSELGWME
ncbi:uncharacterized protein LOC112045863 isoform X2 [Bicyclus anynana]|uniref:Uncharacterized protein LOC112045863 isoform X2 n=2 Tax=Bicyclus anynana TaxID=110368 RepID=A0ABM3LPJ5_BICAN|nr:uncharacterized protein LOC128198645 [Bicyclus anynana]XP_052746982.1 uncharacterized protein LOC112045863 isoform X2 [Bicyclus anynana]XP_052746983.1 uncharacterized protein LOC112045863 isoform X2 [Bicyclus anynana]